MINPPTLQYRHSKKAKHLQIRISHRGLEVIIPHRKRISAADIDDFLASKQGWINKNWPKYLQEGIINTNEISLPKNIYLKAIDQHWEVNYIQNNSTRLTLTTNLVQQITLIGDTSNQSKCIKKLRLWLSQIGHTILVKQLQRQSEITGLNYAKFSIRNNLTRWGSCTSDKHISLCCKLLFLEPELMLHVILHELCHTKVMNHGKSFWRLFQKFDSLAKIRAKQLTQAAASIPIWAR